MITYLFVVYSALVSASEASSYGIVVDSSAEVSCRVRDDQEEKEVESNDSAKNAHIVNVSCLKEFNRSGKEETSSKAEASVKIDQSSLNDGTQIISFSANSHACGGHEIHSTFGVHSGQDDYKATATIAASGKVGMSTTSSHPLNFFQVVVNSNSYEGDDLTWEIRSGASGNPSGSGSVDGLASTGAWGNYTDIIDGKTPIFNWRFLRTHAHSGGRQGAHDRSGSLSVQIKKVTPGTCTDVDRVRERPEDPTSFESYLRWSICAVWNSENANTRALKTYPLIERFQTLSVDAGKPVLSRIAKERLGRFWNREMKGRLSDSIISQAKYLTGLSQGSLLKILVSAKLGYLDQATRDEKIQAIAQGLSSRIQEKLPADSIANENVALIQELVSASEFTSESELDLAILSERVLIQESKEQGKLLNREIALIEKMSGMYPVAAGFRFDE